MSESTEFLPGVAFLINQSERRIYSEQDVGKITDTLEPLNITVIDWSDKSLKDIKKCMVDLKNDWKIKYNHFEYIIMVHLSHGYNDNTVQYALYEEDENAEEGEEEPVPYLISIQKLLLNPLFKIEELNNKFKWLIVQACRGNDDFEDAKTEGDDTRPRYFTKYFLKSYSSTEGGKSYRSPIGAIFIDKLLQQIKNSATTKGVISIMQDTAAEVQNYFDGMAALNDATATDEPTVVRTFIKQSPGYSKNFSGDFYLTRGFVETETV